MSEDDDYNIVVCGVGGMGVLSANLILGESALEENIDGDILLSETHGLSQRGGSILCTTRMGNVYSPLVPEHSAHIIIALEISESLNENTLKYAKKDGSTAFIVNDYSVDNLEEEERIKIKEELKKVSNDIHFLTATEMAKERGYKKSANVIMLGYAIGLNRLPVSIQSLCDVIAENLPAGNMDIAYIGYQQAHSDLFNESDEVT